MRLLLQLQPLFLQYFRELKHINELANRDYHYQDVVHVDLSTGACLKILVELIIRDMLREFRVDACLLFSLSFSQFHVLVRNSFQVVLLSLSLLQSNTMDQLAYFKPIAVNCCFYIKETPGYRNKGIS